MIDKENKEKKEYSWYMLSNAPGFGEKSMHYIYKTLKEKNISINDLFEREVNELSTLFPEIGMGRFSKAKFSCFSQLKDDDRLYSNFKKLKSEGVTIIGLDDERYPQFVLEKMEKMENEKDEKDEKDERNGKDAPPILYCKGYLPLLDQEGVAIVGSRDVGDFEVKITKEIAKKLAEEGFNVISGYAKGVDTSAHLGALEAHGTTTMILSFGTNHITIKRELKDLNWEKNALFVTQFAPYEKFSGQNAMTRNKLVCAMSKAIVVIKSGPERDSSGKMSGTFDTGKSALKMGVPVFVLSPKVLEPAPQGNIDLIKKGGIEFFDGTEIVKFLSEHQSQTNSIGGTEAVKSLGEHQSQTNSTDSMETVKSPDEHQSQTNSKQTELYRQPSLFDDFIDNEKKTAGNSDLA